MSAAPVGPEPDAATYSSMSAVLVIETTRPSTWGLDRTHRNAACAKVAPPASQGRMSLMRAPISVFIAITPTPFELARSMARPSPGWSATKWSCARSFS